MDTIPGNTTTTRVLAVGSSATGLIDVPLDQDWYQVWLTAGVAYQIALNSSGAAPLTDPLVRLLDGSGAEVARNDDAGDGGLNSLLAYTPASSGLYYISAEAFPIGDYTGEYTLSLGETDIAADVTTTATVVPDGFVRGTLQNITYYDPLLDQFVTRYDADWYRVDVVAGERYKLVWSAPGPGGLGADLALYDAAGSVLSQVTSAADWDWSYIYWTAPATGTYFLGLSGAT